MSTPSDGNPWAQPDSPGGPAGQGESGPAPSGYGTPSSPSYGRYGQGQALPVPLPAPPGGLPPVPPGGPQWGQPGYHAPPQPWVNVGGPTEVKPIGGLQNLLIVLSVLTGMGIVVAAWINPNQHQMFQDAINGVTTTQTTSTGYEALSSVSLLLEVSAWVVSCVWLTRARQNAMVLAPQRPRRSEAWIWLGWVVPVVNLWFPKQIVDDVIAATAQATGRPRIATGSWWAAWLSSMALGLVLGVVSLFPPNDALHIALVAVEAVVVTVGLLLWVRIVRWLSVSQDAPVSKPGLATLGQ